MKVKKDFTLMEVAGTTAVLPLGEKTVDFTGMLTLNESGVILWKLLEGGCTKEDLVHALLEEYDVSDSASLSITAIAICFDPFNDLNYRLLQYVLST